MKLKTLLKKYGVVIDPPPEKWTKEMLKGNYNWFNMAMFIVEALTMLDERIEKLEKLTKKQ